MAGRNLVLNKSGIATGTAAKTVLQAKAVNTPLKTKGWYISFKGVVNTDAPILCELIRQTNGGTMSTATSTIFLRDNGITYTPNMTAQHTATAEPTNDATPIILESQYVHPQTGIRIPLDLTSEHIVKEGTWLGFRVTSTVDVNCAPGLEFEE